MTAAPWVDINDGVDRQRDFPGPYYAQAGPEQNGVWSWAILRYRENTDPDFVTWGRARGERAALEAAERAFGDVQTVR